jgi:hypothetical protein
MNFEITFDDTTTLTPTEQTLTRAIIVAFGMLVRQAKAIEDMNALVSGATTIRASELTNVSTLNMDMGFNYDMKGIMDNVLAPLGARVQSTVPNFPDD